MAELAGLPVGFSSETFLMSGNFRIFDKYSLKKCVRRHFMLIRYIL